MTAPARSTNPGVCLSPGRSERGEQTTMGPATRLTRLTAACACLVLAAMLLTSLAGGPILRAAGGTIVHTTKADFDGSNCASSAPALVNVATTEDGTGPTDPNRGEVALAAKLEDYFSGSSLDNTTWSSGTYPSGNSAAVTVSGGKLTLGPNPNGWVASKNSNQYGILEAVVTFSNGEKQHFGWSDVSGVPFATDRYAIFSTGVSSSSLGLYVRTNNVGSEDNFKILSTVPTGPQALRIVWRNEPLSGGGSTDVVEYYLNGVKVHTVRIVDTSSSIGGANFQPLHVTFSNSASAAFNLVADWVRLTPYSASSGTYISCAISAETTPQKHLWTGASWSPSAQPPGTTLTVEIRAADTIAGLTTAPFVQLTNGVPLTNGLVGKYVQYRLTLTTSNTAVSPRLEDITLSYSDLPPPSLSINDVSVPEGNSGTTSATFTVTLNPASDTTVTVNYATANGTAVAPGDYTATSGTLTFLPGETTKTIPVSVNGDTQLEPNETFFVNLSDAVNANIADGQGVGTIVNDDTGSFVYLPLAQR
jgi:hypothetical protein